MPSQAEIEGLRSNLNVLAALAAAEAGKLAASVAAEPPERMETILLAAIPHVLAPFLSAAASLAQAFYKNPAVLGASPGATPVPREPVVSPVRAIAPILGPSGRRDIAAAQEFRPRPAQVAPQHIESSVRWAVAAAREPVQATVADRLEAAVARHVHNAARETITTNAKAEKVRWYRNARAEACAFCRMLATRGPKYLSEESAQRVVGRRGKPRGTRAIGELYHDHCFCLPVAVRAGEQYDPPEYVDAWHEEYQAAALSTNGSVKAIMRKMRENDPPREREKRSSN